MYLLNTIKKLLIICCLTISPSFLYTSMTESEARDFLIQLPPDRPAALEAIKSLGLKPAPAKGILALVQNRDIAGAINRLESLLPLHVLTTVLNLLLAPEPPPPSPRPRSPVPSIEP